MLMDMKNQVEARAQRGQGEVRCRYRGELSESWRNQRL